MRTAHRGPTIIALRARREALQIARDIAYPEIVVPPPDPEDPDVKAFREKLDAQLGVPRQAEPQEEHPTRRFKLIVALFILIDLIILARIGLQLTLL
jgi:hypothetical protein